MDVIKILLLLLKIFNNKIDDDYKIFTRRCTFSRRSYAKTIER